MKKILALAFLVLLIPATLPAAWIDPYLDQLLLQGDPDLMVGSYVILSDRVDLDALKAELDEQGASYAQRHYEVISAFQSKAAATQGSLLDFIELQKQLGNVTRYQSFWIDNAVAVTGNADFYALLALRDDVFEIHFDYPLETIHPVSVSSSTKSSSKGTEPGIEVSRAPELWALGIDGTGIIAGDMDTGADGNHPAFADRYRGLTADPAHCWMDPAEEQTFPHDYSSHGTHTLGTILGDDGAGNQIGMAPGAQWIAAAIIDVPGVNIYSGAIAAFQWFADPDLDPMTTEDVPAVVNNSWRLINPFQKCKTDFWAAMDTAEAAGVAVIFAAGNEGPFPRTMNSPPDRITTDINAFAVGALKLDGQNIAGFSSRGPSGCDNATIKPEITAVGKNVRSSIPDANYGTMSGTSMAAPHVSGAIVLLRQAFPDATVDELKYALYYSAVDLGATGEDNTFGRGRMDVYAAYEFLTNVCDHDQDGYENAECGGNDCNDVDAQIYPGATELCDGKDNACSGAVPTDELDPDNDGVMECEGDCAPDNGDIFPGNKEVCDGIDNNCDGEMLDDELDGDGDGYKGCINDCAPDDPDIHPDAEELCDGLDNDCSGKPMATEVDVDGDGVMDCAGDCNDNDPDIFPGNTEICNDHIDNDCDTWVDSVDPDCATDDDDDDDNDDDSSEPVPASSDDSDDSDGCCG